MGLGRAHQAKRIVLEVHCSGNDDPSSSDAHIIPEGNEVEMVPSVSVEEQPWRWRWQLVRQVVQFGLPALSIPLADPFMSLVDTVCVAQYSSTLEVAALAPTTLIFNFVTYVFNSLSVATISIVADRLGRQNTEGARRAVSTSLFIAALSGTAVMAGLLAFGERLIGATGCAESLVPFAFQYLRIRALAMPAVVVSQVSQSSLLAQKDSFTPFLTVMLTAGLNLVGDVLLITRYGMGLSGAAWATASSQVFGALLLLVVLKYRSKVAPYLYIPAWHEIKAMGGTLGPLGLVYLCKNACYVLIQGTATRMSTLLLAAHTPMWSLWNLCGFCNTPLEQAALAFMPAAKTTREQREGAKVLLGCGMALGLTLGCVGSLLPAYAPSLFTPTAELWPHMRSIAPQGAIALLMSGIDVSASAVLMSRKDFSFLARAMAVSLAVLGTYVALLRWTVGSARPPLAGVWWALVVFFGARAAQSTARLAAVQFGWRQGAGQGATREWRPA